MAFTPFSILRSPSVQAILRPQVSTPTPAPELPPAPSAFFRHTFSSASLLIPTKPLPTPSPLPPLASSAPAPPPQSPPPFSNLCTAIVPISLPRDIITSIPLPTPPSLQIIPVSPVSDLTPALAPLLTFDSIRRSTKILPSGDAPTPFSSIFEALSTTIHRDTLAAPLVEAVASPLRDSMTQFPYTMATNHREFLNRAGIPVSQFGTKSHPHPVHKTIEIAFRSDPDWRWSAVRIFAKTRHKIKEASILGNWRACQTLALMHDAVILLLCPVKKYQRAIFSRYRPSSIYIHASHTPFDLSSWCQAHLTDYEHVTNDYTAYDQSQHGEAVVLEVKKIRFAGIPEHLIQLHVHLKTHVSTQFGPLTCMRLTGEPGTYDDNTEYNIGAIFLQYAITTEAVMVSGDDSLIDSLPPTQFDWPLVSQLLSLRFKTEVGKYSLFCGYYVGPVGAVRSPTALFIKVLQALDDDSIADKMASYLTEFSVGHSLGQPMWNLLPLRSVVHQSALFDFFCRACPRDWKVALRIGNPDPSMFGPILSSVSWASNPVFAMLSFAQRRLLLSSRLGLSSSTMPISSPNEGELPQESQSAPPDSSSPQFSHIEAFLSQHPSARFHPPRPLLSGAGSMESLSALIPLLTELLSHLNTNESAPSSDPVAPDVLPGGSSASRLVRPPKLQAPARSLTSSALLKGPSIQLPFQFIYYDITGVEKGTNSIDISGKDILLTMMKPYSHARLTSLEAVVFPYSASLTYPQTLDAVWSTADAVISGSDIISTYGSQRVTFGGPISSSVQITIPADLTTLNPVIRDSVTYKDTPKLNVAFYQNPDNVALGVSKAVICGSVVIRGVLEVSSVRPSPSKA